MRIILVSIVVVSILLIPQTKSSAQYYKHPIEYHGGLVLTRTPNVYFIWYGTWNGNNAVNIVTNFSTSLSSTRYFRINTTYFDMNGDRPNGGLVYGGAVGDAYSHGPMLSDQDIQEIVTENVLNFALPLDPNGIYVVFTSADVDSTGFCSDRCEYHDQVSILGTDVRYILVGNPERCPSSCASQFMNQGNQMPTPNGNFGADAMITSFAHALNGTITNPAKAGWFDDLERENADRCRSRYGYVYTTANGANANVNLVGRDYLLEQNWVNDGVGYCAIAYTGFVR